MYCRAIISATSKKEAEKISIALVKSRLVAGIMVYKGDCLYWWRGKVVKRIYWNISAFTITKHKKKIIAVAKKLHSDKCPIIAFNEIDGNKDFLLWIKESVKST
jgi:uncharacterized protein involved in tolerance to divalent cations